MEYLIDWADNLFIDQDLEYVIVNGIDTNLKIKTIFSIKLEEKMLKINKSLR